MKIKNLPVGTKLMWDATDERKEGPVQKYVYPAIVTERHHNREWVKIKTKSTSQWMGPESEFLRLPTDKELEALNWPSL